jgi:hypothetical protein
MENNGEPENELDQSTTRQEDDDFFNDVDTADDTVEDTENIIGTAPEMVAADEEVVAVTVPEIVAPEAVAEEVVAVTVPEIVAPEAVAEEVVAVTVPEIVAPEAVAEEVVAVTVPEIVAPEADVSDEISPEIDAPPAEIIPKMIFVVPYRDREQHLAFFRKHMSTVLEDIPKTDYKILFIHQKDTRQFNRGAMKNIGFLQIKKLYPTNYRDITIVFNDVDTMPFTKNFLDYCTIPGKIKHFYGYTYALGGIVSITAGDFETLNGFPNFWAWGFEDNELQKRALAANITIDRSSFYPVMDKNIFQMKDGLTRVVNRTEFDRYISKTNEGINTIADLVFTENDDFVDVYAFSTGTEESPETNTVHDIRKGGKIFTPTVIIPQKSGRRNGGMKMFF